VKGLDSQEVCAMKGAMALNRTVTMSKAHVSIPPPCLFRNFYTGQEI